jgi:hypothetical protein
MSDSKKKIPLPIINKICSTKNKLDLKSIILLSFLGLLTFGLIIHYLFFRNYINYQFYTFYKHFSSYILIYIIIMMLIINCIFIANLKGINISFILNVATIFFLILPSLWASLYYKKIIL